MDHVVPTCLNVELSNDRSIKVWSCEGGRCNGRSDEALLKSFFLLFDSRIAPHAMRHLRSRSGGQGDLWQFYGTCTEDFRTCFLDAKLTSLFKKMFMGLRRYILEKILRETWTFLPDDNFHLYQLLDEGGVTAVRKLPLMIDEQNPPCFYDLPIREIENEIKFRDFHFSMTGNVISLRYGRKDFGNELRLLCYVD
jgi:hypothetical protein